mmetsp:Transcript_8581/g.19113  ORF Transcript_8581/g.19113 Transcript_8581/m.19113 type:complete len:538 (+) Transcript_8581:77-1690(+)
MPWKWPAWTRSRPRQLLRNLMQFEGSVFPLSFLVSAPPAILAAALVELHGTSHFSKLFDGNDEVEERIFSNSAVWSSFTFLVGFLVVFRTSHAYNRFWEACASVHKMGAEWFDSCSALIAYTKVSGAEQSEVVCFQNKVIRLFSLLHAVALAELEDLDNGSEELEVRSFEMELVDAGAFEDETLAAIRDSTCRVELVYQWIQSLIVDAHHRGTLSVPPPILTRSFQELSGGMVNFHDAMKVADTPFPFPYSQTCDALLFFLYVTAPFVVSSYCSKWWLAFFFTFVVLFTFACLTLTGLELEFPYGRDANDIQGLDLQLEMNHKLRLLVSKVGWRHPQLRKVGGNLTALQAEVATLKCVNDVNKQTSRSLSALWESLPAHTFHHPVHSKHHDQLYGASPASPGEAGGSPVATPLPTGAAKPPESEAPSAQMGTASRSVTTEGLSMKTAGRTASVGHRKGKPKAARRGARVRALRVRNSIFNENYMASVPEDLPVTVELDVSDTGVPKSTDIIAGSSTARGVEIDLDAPDDPEGVNFDF